MSLLFLTVVLAGTVHGAMYSQHEPTQHRGPSYNQDRSDVYPYMDDPMAYVYVRPSSDQSNHAFRMSPMPFQPMQYIPTTYHNGDHVQGDGHIHGSINYPLPTGNQYPVDGHNHGHGGKNNGVNFHHSQDGHLHQPSGSPDFPFDFDTPPYQLVQQYPEVGVEERHYKSQNWVCTRAEVDTAADPLAGLEAFPPQELLRSDRYQEGPQGTMHRRLKNYTQGQNKESEVMAETRPISIRHWIKERTNGGNIEVQEMCFYLQHKYQDNHQANQESQKIPQPEDPEVYIFAMPEMTVYVQSFNEVAVTEAMWDYQRQQLEEKLFRMGKQYRHREFFSQCYNVLRLNTNRRSEVWIQKLDSSVHAIAAVSAEVDPGIVESYAPHDDERIMNSVQAHFRHDLADHDHSHGDSHEDHHHDNPEALNDGHSHEDHHHDDHKHDHSKPKNTAGGR